MTSQKDEKKDWVKWLSLAILVLTTVVQFMNGDKLSGVEKKVEQKTEKLEKDLESLSTKVSMSVNANK